MHVRVAVALALTVIVMTAWFGTGPSRTPRPSIGPPNPAAASTTRSGPASFLTMWAPGTADVEAVDDPLEHVAGNQYGGAIAGDTIYLVSVRNGELELCGRLVVGTVTDEATASRALGNRKLVSAPYHVLAAKGTVMPLGARQIHDLAPRLKFADGQQPQGLVINSDGAVPADQLLGLRSLNSESVKLLEDALRR